MAECSRRRFILASALLLGGTGCLSLLTPSRAGANNADDRYFVFVNLRGAADGIATLPPIGDPDYAGLRGALAFNKGEVEVMKNEIFGFNPALSVIRPWYSSSELLFIHAVATPYRSRSHFDGQAILENGFADQSRTDSGWLGRALHARDGAPPAVAIDGGIPLVLAGAKRVMNWSPGNSSVPPSDVVERLASLYDLEQIPIILVRNLLP